MSKIDVVVNGVKYVPENDAAEQGDATVIKDFDSAAFYSSIRKSLFGGSLNQDQVNGINLLGSYFRKEGLNPIIPQSAYILATVYHETARTMQPIEEYGGPSTRYAPWYGRGFVQLTWEENYQKQQKKLSGLDYVIQNNIPYRVHEDRNLALEPRTSAIITIGGMRDGDFTGVGLSDYINATKKDYVNARKIVNGTDKAEEIAGYAELFEEAILLGLGAP